MPIITSTYKAPLWIGGKHAQTIIPALFRRVEGVVYERERITTDDGDFLDLDWSCLGNPRLIIISHGLEGSSYQPYVRGMVKECNGQKWDTLSWNFRSCSGEINRSVRLYHAGCIDDLKKVVDHAVSLKKYKIIILIGFSLGGSVTLKYLGDHSDRLPTEIAKALVFSVPCDLYACAQELSSGINRIYLNRFLATLKTKMEQKAKLYPHLFSGLQVSKIHDLIDFDNYFTAPMVGYKDAMHYYAECSCKKSIPLIRIPTLVINAKNDPFLHPACFPIEECQASNFVTLEFPYDGGHQGFIKKHIIGRYWSEERANQFINDCK
ncbi:MAG: alpha/beta fold hydrolase [Chlamydiae bacterium]|nr:alpha/beta fold hydrolase [Chlamydiota bacterium]